MIWEYLRSRRADQQKKLDEEERARQLRQLAFEERQVTKKTRYASRPHCIVSWFAVSVESEQRTDTEDTRTAYTTRSTRREIQWIQWEETVILSGKSAYMKSAPSRPRRSNALRDGIDAHERRDK